MFFDLLKTWPQYLIPKRSLTHGFGCLAEVKNERVKNYLIQRFIAKYEVNMIEAYIEEPHAYASFNEFFIRRLKPEIRPLAKADVISPVDGCISEIGCIQQGQIIQAKNKTYSVQELLACNQAVSEQFIDGRFATLYLSPKDYHRVHLPIDGQLTAMHYIPGSLFSVQPTTARIVPKLFARNERLVIFFSTRVGPMAIVMVGATIVGSITTSWHGTLERRKGVKHFDYQQNPAFLPLAQGDEIGYFKLGSTVIVLFADGKQVQWSPALTAGQSIRFGQAMSADVIDGTEKRT